jgi:hypothetical protein
MSQSNDFRLETLVDFPDDALSCIWPITPGHIDSMMAMLKANGVTRVIWAYYGDGHGGWFLPSGVAGAVEDKSLSFDQNQWKAYAQTLDLLGNPLRVAVDIAHKHGIEVYAYYKPYETGVAMTFAEGSPQAREWGRLYEIGGYTGWLDPFVIRHPELRIQRRTDDLWPGHDAATIDTIRLTKRDDSPTRIKAENLQIWTSPLNYRYQPRSGRFDFAESVEPSPREVRDVYGNLITKAGDPVRVLTLSGLNIRDRYVLVTTDFTEGQGDFSNAWDRLITCLDPQGREIPTVQATGTAIWFPEWEDFRRGGLCFDTGRGPEVVTLDAPNQSGVGSSEGSAKHHAPEQKKVRGCVAISRGRNTHLAGGLCETEPAVQTFWLSCIQEMLDAGVDGIEFRVENHSCHSDRPEEFGFNPAVMAKLPANPPDLLAAISKVRGDGYTDFLRQAKAMIAAHGRRMRINLNVDWFRPVAERPGSRKLAYPHNVEWQWQRWIDEGLMDEAMLRFFAKPLDGVYGDDKTAVDMADRCRQHDIPVTVNRYVWMNENLADEFNKLRADGRFAGFVLYETWSYLQFARDGRCVPAGQSEVDFPESDAMRQARAKTHSLVRQVFDAFKQR